MKDTKPYVLVIFDTLTDEQVSDLRDDIRIIETLTLYRKIGEIRIGAEYRGDVIHDFLFEKICLHFSPYVNIFLHSLDEMMRACSRMTGDIMGCELRAYFIEDIMDELRYRERYNRQSIRDGEILLSPEDIQFLTEEVAVSRGVSRNRIRESVKSWEDNYQKYKEANDKAEIIINEIFQVINSTGKTKWKDISDELRRRGYAPKPKSGKGHHSYEAAYLIRLISTYATPNMKKSISSAMGIAKRLNR